jgi:hypothetical protein
MPGLSNPPSVAVAVDRSFAAQDPVGLGSSSCSGAIVILIVRRENRTLPHVRDHRGEVVGRIFRSAASFDVGNAANVSAEFRNKTSLGDNLDLWTVFFPRRSITGKLVRGRVWRRHDGRRWIYKRFVEYDNAEA